MTANLSGLKVEYAIALIYSSEAGKREATLGFDVGQGTQDLGFRGEVPVLFDVRPGRRRSSCRSRTTTASRPSAGSPSRDKRGPRLPAAGQAARPGLLLPGQIYRHDGGTVLLPPGEFTMEYGRGPEYQLLKQDGHGPGRRARPTIEVKLERWINPMDYGFYSGDHHIHAAGCAHYTSPTEGVFAEDMFLHVKGEGLNVGCCLTWGPCFDFQRQFFEPRPHKLSEPFTRAQVRHRGERLRLAGAGPRLPAEPARPDLPRLRRHQDQGLADLDHAADALGQGAGGRHRLRPLGQRPAASTRRPPPSGCSPRSTRTRTASSAEAEAAKGPAARAVRRRSTPTATAT